VHLVVIGVNHNTAPVEIREKFAFPHAEAIFDLKLINEGILECCMLSTCNRTELYAVTENRADDETLLDFLANQSGIQRSLLDTYVYSHSGHHAAKHLFKVACGLDSMVLGETQILGQIKNAYCMGSDCDHTGSILNNLFQRAIAVGKRARTETRISKGAFSIGAAAVELAKFVFGSLSGRTALLIGAGKMSKLATTHLKSNGVSRVYVCSRTLPRVEKLVEELGGEAVEIERLEEVLAESDLVISSTSSLDIVITREIIERAMSSRKGPLFLIDIAVPRDIDSTVADIDGVFLYDIDDLRFLVERCECEREAEIDKVMQIIDEQTAEFASYLRGLEAVPLIRQLRDKFDSVYEIEWDRCASKLAHLSDEDKEIVRRALKSTVTKLTHDPIIRMKDYASNGGKTKLDIVRELFGIPENEP
jgi:glutamyl-tRNA reductase